MRSICLVPFFPDPLFPDPLFILLSLSSPLPIPILSSPYPLHYMISYIWFIHFIEDVQIKFNIYIWIIWFKSIIVRKLSGFNPYMIIDLIWIFEYEIIDLIYDWKMMGFERRDFRYLLYILFGFLYIGVLA